MVSKAYLGDGVYAEYSTQHGYPEIVLTTENGVSVTNRIVLDADTLSAFMQWIRQLEEQQW